MPVNTHLCEAHEECYILWPFVQSWLSLHLYECEGYGQGECRMAVALATCIPLLYGMS